MDFIEETDWDICVSKGMQLDPRTALEEYTATIITTLISSWTMLLPLI